jgi:hypothetical protein
MGLQVKSARANKMYWHLILFAALHQDAGPHSQNMSSQILRNLCAEHAHLIRSLNFRRGYLRVITNHIGLREHEILAELRAAAINEDCN